MYIGGNIEQFVPGGPKLSVDLFSGAARAAKIEGTLTFGAADFTFETGRAGSLTIPYNAVEHVEYGIRTSPRAGGVVHFIPWNPYEQVTKKAHGLLTIVLKHQDGRTRALVLEPGEALVKPALEALERRTGIPITFREAEVCVRFRSAEACDYGQPSELKGRRRIHLGDMARDDRELIRAELSHAALEVVLDPESADVVLNLYTEYSTDPGCPCEGGRGEALVVSGERRRTLFVFHGSKRGVWGTNPAVGFGRAFVAELAKANAGRGR